ncbi:hypothetical protein TRSC58_07310 [Trypanosoma rangeli SC58]|uniref:Uncharacterized protein n=1 Tax=Trypanosoma rangeli SC58 TaxID=429131 RepID=A0A061IS44_TRYRA|nr:hypothetical protein TRSC58_07310 [Trypanosoma rangeli SC58]
MKKRACAISFCMRDGESCVTHTRQSKTGKKTKKQKNSRRMRHVSVSSSFTVFLTVLLAFDEAQASIPPFYFSFFSFHFISPCACFVALAYRRVVSLLARLQLPFGPFSHLVCVFLLRMCDSAAGPTVVFVRGADELAINPREGLFPPHLHLCIEQTQTHTGLWKRYTDAHTLPNLFPLTVFAVFLFVYTRLHGVCDGRSLATRSRRQCYQPELG